MRLALGLVALALVACAEQCTPVPVPSPGPVASYGGSGPLPSTGGSAGVGGQVATGGSAGCPVVTYPDAPVPQASGMAKRATRRKLPPRHFRWSGRARMALPLLPPLCSGGSLPLVLTPLNQVDGSCTGAATVGMISSPPFTSAPHFNLPDSLAAYQGGTCIDNGCSVCTCAGCKAAYCPATHANDNGSTGGSVSEWMVARGWLSGYHAADTTDELMAELSSGKSCVIGVDWRRSMWDPDPTTGEIRVDLGTPQEGGHEMQAVLNDVARQRVYIRNSWGAWGMCYRDQITARSAIDGTGCGYGWIEAANLVKLRFDGDCPN